MSMRMHQRFLTAIGADAAAFTTTELMIATAATTMIAGGLAATLVACGRSELYLSTRSSHEDDLRYASLVLAQDLRGSKGIVSYANNVLTLTNSDGVNITYSFDPSARTFVKSRAGASKTLLTSCSAASFDFYARPLATATNLSFGVLSTSAPVAAGFVNASFLCRSSNYCGTVTVAHNSGRIEIRNR